MKTTRLRTVGSTLSSFGQPSIRKLWTIIGALFVVAALPLIAQPALGSAGGLVGHWNFDEGSGPVAADSSGNGNHGQLLSGPQWQTTPLRAVALLFDGVNDSVNVGNSPSLNPPDQITLAAWVAPYDVSASGEIIAKSNGTDPQYFLRVQAGGRIRFGISGAVLNGNITLSTFTWHLVAGTYDGSTMKIYVDGVLDAVMSQSGPMHDNGADVLIGCRAFRTPLVFNGLIDDPQIYNRAVSANEMQALGSLVGHWRFDEGTGTAAADSSGYGNHGRLQDGPQWQTTPLRPVALLFDGVNDHVNVGNSPSLNPPDQLTLAAWVSPYGLSASGEIIAKSNGTDAQYFLRVQAGGKIRFGIGGTVLNGNITLSPFVWHLVAGAYDGSTMKIYVDGALDAVSSKSGPMHDNGVDVSIGSRTFRTPLVFNGLIDDPQIYNRALSQNEIFPTSNDNFADSFDLAQITTGNNVNATREPGEPPSHNPGGASAGHSVWWHWTAPGDGWAIIGTVGSTFDTVLAVYTGNSVDNLRLISWNNDRDNSAAAIATFFSTAGTTYQIAVDGVPGAWGDIQLNVRYDLPPTVSLISPRDGDIFPPGTPVQFEATASDSDGWVTQVKFTVENSDTAVFEDLVVSASPFTIEWMPPRMGRYFIQACAYDNDGFADCTARGETNFTVGGVPPIVRITSPPDGQTFRAPASIPVSGTLESDSGLQMFKLDLSDGTTTTTATPAYPYFFNYTFPPLGMGDYVLTATATDGMGRTTTTSVHLHVVDSNAPPPNDNFANSFDLAQTATGDNLNATTEPGEPNPGFNAGGHSIWWHWTAPSNGPVVLTTTGTGFQTVLAVYEGSQVNQLGGVQDYDRYFDPVANKYSLMATGGVTYQIAVDGIAGAMGTIVVAQRYGAQPTVSFSSPHDGDFFPLGTSILFYAIPHDTDGYSYVDFITIADDLNGGNVHQNFLNDGARDYIRVNYTPPEPGIYSVQAGAYDDDGFEELPNGFHITVGHGRETVSITSPADGAVFNAPADIPVHVTGRNFDGTVVKVDLTDGTTTFTSTVMDFDYTFAAHGPGNYTLTATATDNTGATATSSVHVSVVIPRPANDDFANSFDLAQITTGNNVDATIEPGEPDHNPSPIGRPLTGHSVWWHWTAPSDGNIVFSTLGSSFDTIMALYPLRSDGSLGEVRYNDNWNDTNSWSKVSWRDVVAGTTFYIAVDGVAGELGDIQLNVRYGALPTINLISPRDGEVFLAGTPILFEASASDSDGSIVGVGFQMETIMTGNFVGGVFVDTSPYVAVLSPTELGQYWVYAEAIDDDGFSGQFFSGGWGQWPIISYGGIMPSASIISPVHGQVFDPTTTAITIRVNVIPGDSAITQVDFYSSTNLDNTFIGTVTSPPYELTWYPAAPDVYSLDAYVTDSHGFFVRSEPDVIIALEADYPVFPVVTLAGGSPPWLIAWVSNFLIPPDRVEFYALTPPSTKTLLGVAPGFLHLNSGPADYPFSWNNAVPGDYDLTAKAIFGSYSVESPVLHHKVGP